MSLLKKEDIFKEFGKNNKDSGSTESQIALFSSRIKSLSEHLKDNAKDLLYGKAQWFMAENKVKRSGVIRTTTAPYDWVTDNLSPESNWKK